MQEPLWIGEPVRVPREGAGVGVRLPAGFKTEHVAGNVALAELVCERKDGRVIAMHLGPVPEAQAPVWWRHASAGEEGVTLDSLEDGGAGEKIHIDARSPGHFDQHLPGLRLVTLAGVIRR